MLIVCCLISNTSGNVRKCNHTDTTRYDLADDINAANGGFEVADMGVKWRDSAFAANAAAYPHLDYSLVKKDTHMQDHVHKSTPFIHTQ